MEWRAQILIQHCKLNHSTHTHQQNCTLTRIPKLWYIHFPFYQWDEHTKKQKIHWIFNIRWASMYRVQRTSYILVDVANIHSFFDNKNHCYWLLRRNMSIICKFDDVSSKLVPESKAISFAFIKGKKTDHEQKKVRMCSNGIATDKKQLELLLTGTRFRHRMLCGILKSSTLNTVVVVTGSNFTATAAAAAVGVVNVFSLFFSMAFGQQKPMMKEREKPTKPKRTVNITRTYTHSIRCKKCEICWIHLNFAT